eukprot:COSAG05_NODE_19811_length_287_cov_1.074468_1_plen_61_part_01
MPGKLQQATQRAALLKRGGSASAVVAAAVHSEPPRRGGTRGYRAPEVLMGCTNMHQSAAID